MAEYNSPLVRSIAKIVKETLQGIDMYSDEAFDLVMRTGMAESGYRNIEQHPRGPGIGFWQIEMSTADNLWYHMLVYRTELRNKIYAVTGIDKRVESGPFTRFQILTNIALGIVLCRLRYKWDPDPIPSDLEGQAHYWKKVYNTPEGKGTVEKFINTVNRMEK